LVLVDGTAAERDIVLAAQVTARFSQGRDAAQVTVEVTDRNREPSRMDVAPIPSSQVPQEWYL
jgi:hypothetical protein